MSYDEVLLDTEERMEKTFEVLKGTLRGVRTGRATPALVENIRVDYYGAMTPLKQLSTITTPDSRMIMIKPFDPSSLSSVEKAILKSEVGLTPSVDGKLIRLQVPPLSEERRKQLVGQVKEHSEAAKVSLRNVRRDANKQSESFQKESILTEDDSRKLKEEVQNLTKEYEDKIKQVMETKQTEILDN